MPRILDVDSDVRYWHNVKPITNVTDQVAQTTTPVAPASGSLRGTVSPFGIPGDSVDRLSVNRLVTGTLRTGEYINVNDKAGISAAGVTGADIRIWAGDTWENRAIAPFRVTDDGDCVASSFATGTDISILDFQFDGEFSATDNDTVAWTSGTLTFSNGETFAINAGNTGNMTLFTYIYFDKNVSGTALQVSTVTSDANGNNKKLIAVAEPTTNTSSDAEFQVYGGSGGLQIGGPRISRFTMARNRNTYAFDANRIPNRYADFEQFVAGDNIGLAVNGNVTSSTDEIFIGTKVMKMVATSPDCYVWLGDNSGDYNIPLEPSTKYLASFYAKGAAGGERIDCFLKQDDATVLHGTPASQDITSSWARYHFEFTTTAGLTEHGILRIDNDDNGATIYIDAIQVEQASDADTPEPSEWKPGATSQIHTANLIGGLGIEEITSTSFNSDGQLSTLVADGDTYTFTYDDAGQLLTMDDTITTFTVNRSGDGMISTITLS